MKTYLALCLICIFCILTTNIVSSSVSQSASTDPCAVVTTSNGITGGWHKEKVTDPDVIENAKRQFKEASKSDNSLQSMSFKQLLCSKHQVVSGTKRVTKMTVCDKKQPKTCKQCVIESYDVPWKNYYEIKYQNCD